MNRTADIVLDSFPDQREALREMHKQARRLRRRRVTKRYGVFVEMHRGVWWVILHDRGNG